MSIETVSPNEVVDLKLSARTLVLNIKSFIKAAHKLKASCTLFIKDIHGHTIASVDFNENSPLELIKTAATAFYAVSYMVNSGYDFTTNKVNFGTFIRDKETVYSFIRTSRKTPSIMARPFRWRWIAE